jgi:hypothetical protein
VGVHTLNSFSTPKALALSNFYHSMIEETRQTPATVEGTDLPERFGYVEIPHLLSFNLTFDVH